MLRSVHVLIDRYIKCTFDALHIIQIDEIKFRRSRFGFYLNAI